MFKSKSEFSWEIKKTLFERITIQIKLNKSIIQQISIFRCKIYNLLTFIKKNCFFKFI